jgi:hypothetical protein
VVYLHRSTSELFQLFITISITSQSTGYCMGLLKYAVTWTDEVAILYKPSKDKLVLEGKK